MATYAWLDDAWYAAQKVAQMKATNDPLYTDTGNDLADFNAALQAYNTANNTSYTIDDNFDACNQFGYDSTIPQSAINVSPNKFFDVTYYLQSKANAVNAADATAAATPQTVLNAMYEGGYSAWAHYVEMADGVDPSALFSTQKYLEAKAAALTAQGTATTAADVKADLQAKGYNAIMDFMENGAALNITEEMVKPDADKVLTNIGMNPTDVWVEPVAPADPYDNIQATETIAAGDTGPYTGEDGVNTEFSARWTTNSQDRTLNADDVITGGGNGALNTLSVEMGADWTGFKGIAGETIADPRGDNVTNVGRIKIDRQPGVNSRSEQGLTFNAQYISDEAVQYDLNAAGSGATSLTNLGNNVARINLKDLVAQDINGNGTMETSLKWEDAKAHSGNDDSLTIGLNNAGAKSPAPVVWGSGIEHVTIDAVAGTTNGVDLYAAPAGTTTSKNTGIKDITVTGDGDVNVRSLATGVKTYDASQAGGNVTFTTYSLTNQTVKGGQGTDTVVLENGGDTAAKNWDSIETVTFSSDDTSNPTNLNAAGYSGLQNVWIVGKAEHNITNLEAAELQVYQSASTDSTKDVSINGNASNNQLGDVTWQTASGKDDGAAIEAHFSSNATGTATIKAVGKDTIADSSEFAFSKAKTVLLGDEDNALSGGDKLGLVANEATALIGVLDGEWLITKDKNGTQTSFDSVSLAKLQNLNLTLTDSGDVDPDVDMTVYNLPNIQNVTIEGDGSETVLLGNLGSTGSNGNPGIQMDISGVAGVAMGTVSAGLGGNILGTIDATGDVVFGDITTSTNLSGNDQGDIDLTVSGSSIIGIGGSGVSGSAAISSPTGINATSSEATLIEGGRINLDFSGVSGDVGVNATFKYLELKASEGITYVGAEGKDEIMISGVGANSTSTINPGAGSDRVYLSPWDLGKAGARSDVVIDLRDGEGDQLVIQQQQPLSINGGFTVVRVLADNIDTLGNQLGTSDGWYGGSAGVQTLLKDAGLGDIQLSSTPSAVDTSNNCFFEDSNGVAYGGIANDGTGFIVIWDATA